MNIDIPLYSLMHLKMDGSMDLDTRAATKHFHLAISGELSIFDVIKLSGGS